MAIDRASNPRARPTLPLRAAIAECLELVIAGGFSLDRALEQYRPRLGDPREQGFLQECVYGVLRHVFSLRASLADVLERPLRSRETLLECLLLAGIYQLREMSCPPHAVVNESVAACQLLDRGWAKGLVNAVLRNTERRGQALQAGADEGPEAQWDHPQWLIGKLAKAWPDDWQALLTAANARPPLSLRVNALRVTRDDYLAQLLAAGIQASAVSAAPQAVVLAQAMPVRELPGFAEGLCSVQDLAAQLAAPLLAPRAGHRVLDACAAPGGKTMHLLELTAGQIDLLALDLNDTRLGAIRESVTRLGLACAIRQGDAGDPDSWWDGVPFDRILLDAPCSGSGVIRRHPDIKLHRRPEDLAALADTQRRLLDQLWPTLAAGGLMLYATCSVLPAENEHLVREFCAAQTDCEVLPIEVSWGRATGHGRQILTGEERMDGFFYSLLRKRSDG